mmetsp:Transcript_17328/g.35908  ORF Transcript_17328/g.35908 Transcript_17328/m.35908 type:complete len:216 (-) Transcript_17328:72-719(-)
MGQVWTRLQGLYQERTRGVLIRQGAATGILHDNDGQFSQLRGLLQRLGQTLHEGTRGHIQVKLGNAAGRRLRGPKEIRQGRTRTGTRRFDLPQGQASQPRHSMQVAHEMIPSWTERTVIVIVVEIVIVHRGKLDPFHGGATGPQKFQKLVSLVTREFRIYHQLFQRGGDMFFLTDCFPQDVCLFFFEFALVVDRKQLTGRQRSRETHLEELCGWV